ncbi:DUF420 domain-containing protein [Mucilaginibacter sp. OK283]|jgi:putative membrane protein|uniref:DUF420 domain-containing protein n=1 Tax=Mucilaginibacter sp. OK283 TaxID=1881049 RepID=UPI0008D5111B|nr:DUF420 domain-containing protein [Mucilaginibacter sp. OK283]SEO93202.1 putative membrane protein [Mucilaginibacter sp. OK283]
MKKEQRYIWALALAINGLIALSVFLPKATMPAGINVSLLPKVNAVLNGLTFAALLVALLSIRRKRRDWHRRFIGVAFAATSLFLVSYLAYHFTTPSTKYGGASILRHVYYLILTTHILLAIIIVPLAMYTMALALKNQVDRHRKLARWTMPVWLYVSLTGVIVYLMIAPYYVN